MAADASDALGTPQLAGSFVSPKGLTKQMTAGAAGTVVGGAAGSMAAHMATGGLQWDGAPDFGRVGYVAVTADEIAIIRGKTGLMKPKVGSEVVARAPRGDIVSVELDPGALKAALTVRFADGSHWEFEVPKINRKTAQQVVSALGAHG